MREITRYIANDGKEFDSEYDCKEYEIKLGSNSYKDTLKVYDKDNEEIKLDTLLSYYDFDAICFIVIKSREAYSWLYDSMYDYYGMLLPEYDDVEEENFNCAFYYDFDYDKWFSCKKKIEEYKKEIEKLSKYVVDKE